MPTRAEVCIVFDVALEGQQFFRSWSRRVRAHFPIHRARLESSIIGIARYPHLEVDSCRQSLVQLRL